MDAVRPTVRAALLSGFRSVTFAAGATVVRAGDVEDSYYVITEGAAEVLTPLGERIATLGAGQGFGELALLLSRPRSASVVARTPLKCMRLTAEQFNELTADRDHLLAVTRALAARQADDVERLEASFQTLKRSLRATVRALAGAVEARDAYTGSHVERTGQLSRLLAAEMGLSDTEQERVEWGGLLHDVGKVAVPDAVLRKPGPLTREEFALVRVHPAAGAAVVERVEGLRHVAAAVRGHHERWSGGGYPDGLRGEEIPLEAKIVAVADAWDAMTTDRTYRVAQSREFAIREIETGRGTQFAPQVADALLRLIRRGATLPT